MKRGLLLILLLGVAIVAGVFVFYNPKSKGGKHRDVAITNPAERFLVPGRKIPSLEVSLFSKSGWSPVGSAVALVPKEYRYIEETTAKERTLTRYLVWEGTIYNRTETVQTDYGKGGGPVPRELYQRIQLRVYAPQGQFWSIEKDPASLTNVLFFDFDSNDWHGLTIRPYSNSKTPVMTTGFSTDDNDFKPSRPLPDFMLAGGDIKAGVYNRGRNVIVLYEKPDALAVVLEEETNCLTLDIDPQCTFYIEGLLEKLSGSGALQSNILLWSPQ